MTRAFIMAAGFGTRLEPLTLAVPKPMVPIANIPIMQHNLRLLGKWGIKDICANIHYFPEQIENYFGDGSQFGVNLSYSYEEKLLGTAGGVKKMADLVGGVKDAFVVLSADALTDINISELLGFHKKKKALVTIALSSVLDTSQFGVVVLGNDGKVTEFQEKPLPGKALSCLANTGIYVFDPDILKMIPAGEFHDFGKELFPKMVSEKHAVYGYQLKSYWSDIGSIDQYLGANSDAMLGKIHTASHGKKLGRSVKLGHGVKISGQVLVGDNVEIGDHVELIGPAVIGDKCVIKAQARIEKSVIWSDTYIGKASKVSESIIGNWCHLGDEVEIGPGSVVANRCKLMKGTKLDPGSKIKPDASL